jgi:uncharacterized membrane protein
MAAKSRTAARRWPYILRVVHSRWRFFLAAAVCAVLSLAPTRPDPWARFLIAWDVAVALYLGLVLLVMHGATVAQIRARSAQEDEGRAGILLLTVAAAGVSIIAIIVEMAGAQGGDPGARAMRIGFALSTILLSWTMIHVSFALHYAHEFYDEDVARGHAPLEFPGGEAPDYWDFTYFSFVIGMTSQVSDVQITSRAMRRTATAHGITSFLFNMALLSLMINVAASFISGG